MTRFAGALLFLLLAVACQPERLVAALPPDSRVDTYTQQSASEIDVLWVVDNSGSMVPRQQNLAKNFQSFISEFTANSVDFRIGITTTDVFKEAGQFVGTPRVLTPATPNLGAAFAANVMVGVKGTPYEVGMEAARLALEFNKRTNAEPVKRPAPKRCACARATA